VEAQGERQATFSIPDGAAPQALVVFLHGSVPHGRGRPRGTAPSQGRIMLDCLAAPALGFLKPVIIAPRSPDGQWWTRSDTEFVLGLVRAAESKWPSIGLRRVIMGYSNGGIGTWYFARLYPEYFAAAVPMASNDSIVGDSPLPIYALQGTRDEQFDI